MIIHPRGFGDDFKTWSDQMIFLVGKDVPQLIKHEDGDDWREWAMCIVGAQDRLGQDSPDPYAFDRWQDWAERLFQTQDFSG